MTRLLWLAGGAALIVAAALWLRDVADDAPPAAPATAVETREGTPRAASVLRMEREQAPSAECETPPAEATPRATPVTSRPEPVPTWIDAASFVAAGLTQEEADALVGGLKSMHEHIQRSGNPAPSQPDLERMNLLALLVLDAGPSLAEGIRKGTIEHRWNPSAQATAGSLGCTALATHPADGRRLSHVALACWGRSGILELKVPVDLCDAAHLTRWDAAIEAGR